MTPTSPQQPSTLQNILNFLFGRSALQSATQQPVQPNPVVPAQNTNPLQDQVTQYMMNLKQQQELDKKKKKIILGQQ